MTLRDQLQDLIAKDKSEVALKQLSETLRGTEEGNTITLLQARWVSNKNAYNMGILNADDYNRERNRINYALLSVIGELEENPRRVESVQAVQKDIQLIQNIYNVSGDVVQGDKIGGDKVMGYKNVDNRVTQSREVSPNEPNAPRKGILFIAANPNNTNETYSGKESQMIQKAIDIGHLRHQFELNVNFASNIEDVLRLLKVNKPAIVHFSMHGSNKGMLFEGAFGAAKIISPEILASFFELINMRQKSVECVLLSACNSIEHAIALNQYVDYVIGMKGLIPAQAAIEYSKCFYNALLTGDDYDMAHRSAKLQLKHFASSIDYQGDTALEDIPELFIPRSTLQ